MGRNGLKSLALALGFAGLLAVGGVVPIAAADAEPRSGDVVSANGDKQAAGETTGQGAAEVKDQAKEGEPLKPARKKG
ncbi:MAG: hypothetical protein BWK76_18465 [Desulfobulbaceae bacterium A2]|nr:MAG: hypothetical protein BWK76_18465 [Desulfobulbaceae bacterium A2]